MIFSVHPDELHYKKRATVINTGGTAATCTIWGTRAPVAPLLSTPMRFREQRVKNYLPNPFWSVPDFGILLG